MSDDPNRPDLRRLVEKLEQEISSFKPSAPGENLRDIVARIEKTVRRNTDELRALRKEIAELRAKIPPTNAIGR